MLSMCKEGGGSVPSAVQFEHSSFMKIGLMNGPLFRCPARLSMQTKEYNRKGGVETQSEDRSLFMKIGLMNGSLFRCPSRLSMQTKEYNRKEGVKTQSEDRCTECRKD